jgi:hypothetical protein
MSRVPDFRLLSRALVIPAFVGIGAMALPAPAAAQFGINVSVAVAPPELPVYDQPPLPAPGYIWTPGYWAYGEFGYYWVPGTWVEPPEVGLLWTPGYWGFVGGQYLFNAGYWGPHVGYYGGIDYGFGYGGIGYEGGFWRGGVFSYNSAVNRFGDVHVTNVYNREIVRNENVTRASFNGPGGVVRAPTPQESSFAHEAHVRPTPVQMQHVQMAQQNRDLRFNANHGHPAILATARPAVFTGAAAHPGPEAHPGMGMSPHPAARPVGGPGFGGGMRPMTAHPAGAAMAPHPGPAMAPHEASAMAPREAAPAPHAPAMAPRGPAMSPHPMAPHPMAPPRPAPHPAPPAHGGHEEPR